MVAKAAPAIRLRVWHVPQMPMPAFKVEVANLVEAKLILDALAEYDLFQFHHNVKPDYCNAGGLQVWEDGEWIDWWSKDGREFDDFTLDELREAARKRVAP